MEPAWLEPQYQAEGWQEEPLQCTNKLEEQKIAAGGVAMANKHEILRRAIRSQPLQKRRARSQEVLHHIDYAGPDTYRRRRIDEPRRYKHSLVERHFAIIDVELRGLHH